MLPEKIERITKVNGEEKIHFENRYCVNDFLSKRFPDMYKDSVVETNPNYWEIFLKGYVKKMW